MITTPNLYDLDYSALTQLLAGQGFSPYYAGLLWTGLYREGKRDPASIEGLNSDVRAWLRSAASLALPEPVVAQTSSDGTRKFLLGLEDGEVVESVLMSYRDRFTACISTQAGCAMGCVFCATGQMGFARHLAPGEIVGQVLQLQLELAKQGQAGRLRNLVLMGMGEPLHNYEATMTAVDILTDDRGLAIAPRHITLSTVGLVPGIRRLADEGRPIHLAVSLHGATDEERNRLVPIGRRWPLSELMEACRYYVTRRKRRIFFEWTLIQGQNDTPEQAHSLGKLLYGIESHVNLIPLNATEAFAGAASPHSAATQFQQILADYGIPSTVRRRRGIDIAAGCGQLRSRTISPS